MPSLFQREGEGSSGGGGQEGGGERGVVSGPARLEEEAHPTTEQDIARHSLGARSETLQAHKHYSIIRVLCIEILC